MYDTHLQPLLGADNISGHVMAADVAVEGLWNKHWFLNSPVDQTGFCSRWVAFPLFPVLWYVVKLKSISLLSDHLSFQKYGEALSANKGRYVNSSYFISWRNSPKSEPSVIWRWRSWYGLERASWMKRFLWVWHVSCVLCIFISSASSSTSETWILAHKKTF